MSKYDNSNNNNNDNNSNNNVNNNKLTLRCRYSYVSAVWHMRL